MGAIIAITGKAGAGKSTVLSNLACLYAHSKATVGVLSCDLRYSSLPHIFGGLDEISEEKSLGMLFRMDDIKDTFTEYKHVPNLFISAPSASDACYKYEPPDANGILSFLAKLAASFDYTIIEAGEVQLNHFSALSCVKADALVNVTESSLQGASWEQSCYQILQMYRGGMGIINVLNEPHKGVLKDAERYIGHKVDVHLKHNGAVSRASITGTPSIIDNNAGIGARKLEKAISALYTHIEGMLLS